VSQFVEECRREWKRLRVPSTIADEMANDLTADLAEAEADGATAEDVLGTGASDPRAFAAAWASERGIARMPWSDRLRRRWLLFLAVPALAVMVLAVGAVLAFTSIGESSAPRSETGVTPTQIVPGRIVGTSLYGATVTPPFVVLVRKRPNVLHTRPQSITITLGDSGTSSIDVAHLTVSIGRHTYRFTLTHLVPGKLKSVDIPFAADLPTSFRVVAMIRALPGETNASNNVAIWRVAIAK
jgi:hypothetical protein